MPNVSKVTKVTNQPVRNNKTRNQLVGLATLLFIIAAVSPWVVTDKSKLRTPTTPILTPSVMNAQNQHGIADNENHNHNSNSNNIASSSPPDSDIPYIPNTDEGETLTNTTVDPEVAAASTSNNNTLPVADGKTYLIQLVALKNRQKIEELVALLRLNSYDVKLMPKNPAPDQLVKLVIGPYAKKEQAEQVIIDLNNLTKLKGIIVAN
ncbi:SPOR domain-containing protein [Orbaceae bacterium ESL0727]|nr:SPOR domain-containing protein [Orbaceae bacterium ESL0727]